MDPQPFDASTALHLDPSFHRQVHEQAEVVPPRVVRAQGRQPRLQRLLGSLLRGDAVDLVGAAVAEQVDRLPVPLREDEERPSVVKLVHEHPALAERPRDHVVAGLAPAIHLVSADRILRDVEPRRRSCPSPTSSTTSSSLATRTTLRSLRTAPATPVSTVATLSSFL